MASIKLCVARRVIATGGMRYENARQMISAFYVGWAETTYDEQGTIVRGCAAKDDDEERTWGWAMSVCKDKAKGA